MKQKKKKKHTSGPPTASSNILHSSVVLESIHTGDRVTEKATINCMDKNCAGSNCCKYF